MSGTLLLRGTRLVDPAGGHDDLADVAVENGRVVGVGLGLDATGAEVVDCGGLVLTPGFVDLHTHLREPGGEAAETILTGSRAGALGGYTALCPMPNTNPPADTAFAVEAIAARGRSAGLVDLFPVGAVTVGRAGEQLAELGSMATSAAGVDCFSDDGSPVRSARLMRQALEYARMFDAVIADHPEEPSLTEGAHMHEGELSGRLGLAGWPAAAEEIAVARDLRLAELTGGRLHLCHLSTAGSVELVRAAKTRGVPVTAEVTPHHLTLTDAALSGYDPLFKVNPPLRTDADVAALRVGLADGTIDAVATDHAPHTPEAKDLDFASAPPGMLNLETALAVLLTDLVRPGHLTLPRAVEVLTAGPARVRRVTGHGGPVRPGAPASLTLFDPSERWTVEPEQLASRARNSPFAGRTLYGRVVHTLLRGSWTVRDRQVLR